MSTAKLPTIEVRFESVEKLEAEFESNLSKGGLFAAGATGVAERAVCEVLLIHPATKKRLSLQAEAVWVKPDEPGQGIGVQFTDFDDEAVERIRNFVAEQARGAKEDGKPAAHVYERLRGITAAEQFRIARSGSIQERTALEKIYGKQVWEALLQNPSITPPEVARIAKKGTLPKPTLELIAGNGGWVSTPHVRRALLTNHRLSQGSVEKILRLIPKGELAVLPKQTVYPERVRQAAKRMLAQGGGLKR